jgi:hypothetical protein
MAVPEKEVPKEKDVGQIVRYLSGTFNQATGQLERAFRGKGQGPNLAYRLQTEFAYLLNEVTQGPRCVLQKNITACNEFIDQVVQDLNQQAANRQSA